MEIKLNQIEEKLFSDAEIAYGQIAQLEQFSEECLEAALAVRKYVRAYKNGNFTNPDEVNKRHWELISEIADVLIMAKQSAIIVGKGSVMVEIDSKINRQIKRVEKKLNPKL